MSQKNISTIHLFKKMKYTSTLRQNIKVAKDPMELYLIGYLQEFHFKKINREKYKLIDNFSNRSIDFELIKKAFPDDRDLRIFLTKTINQFKSHTLQTIPWEKYDDLALRFFKKVPWRQKSEKLCIDFIKTTKYIDTNAYKSIPKPVLKKSKPLVRLLLSRFKKAKDRSFIINSLVLDTFEAHKKLWTSNSKYFVLWLKYRDDPNPYNLINYYELPSQPFKTRQWFCKDFAKFNFFPEELKKSKEIIRAIIPTIERYITFTDLDKHPRTYSGSPRNPRVCNEYINHYSDFFKTLDKDLLMSLSYTEAISMLNIIEIAHKNNIFINTFTYAFLKRCIEDRKNSLLAMAHIKLKKK